MVVNSANPEEVKQTAAEIEAEIRALPVRNTPEARKIRQKYSQQLKQASPEFIFDLARELQNTYGQHWIGYELIWGHKAAFQRLGEAELEELGQGIDSWWSVDAFGRTLAGPAWLRGQVTDALIYTWAVSPDFWWRRAALVSTVALNMRSQGGRGDTRRTLAVCRRLAADHEDMVVKALSWALRELVVHDAQAVENFLDEYQEVLHARVKREVLNKLRTGLKTPRLKGPVVR
jgi:3-methyladenine DNA glycosylase AlkD